MAVLANLMGFRSGTSYRGYKRYLSLIIMGAKPLLANCDLALLAASLPFRGPVRAR